MTVHRNRVIYQSEALFISPDSTGAHFTGAAIKDAANPGDYANLAANVGPGPFGLFTPPKDIRQVHGGTEASPATNNAQNLVGWQEGDVWPVWNPDCVTVGTFASFAGVVEIENGTSNVQINAVNAGVAGNVLLTGDGVSTLNQLVAAQGVALNVVSGGTDIPDAGFQIQLLGGVNEATAQAGSPISSLGDNVLIEADNVNGGNVTLNGTGGKTIVTLISEWNGANAANTIALQNAGTGGSIVMAVGQSLTLIGSNATTKARFQGQIIGVVPFAGSISSRAAAAGAQYNGITLIGDGVSTTTQLIIAYNGNVANVLKLLPVLAGGWSLVPDDGTQIIYNGGVDGVAAAFQDAALPIENGQSNVSIDSDDRGERGNVLLVGDGVSNVNALAALSPVNLTVNSGGTDIPDLGENIQLVGGINASPCAHGTIVKQLKRIQSANYGFTVTRQDVNQFGHMSRLDSIVVESPTVNLDFSYYLLDGYNERMLEFVTDGVTNALSGALSPELYQAGNNYFILTVPEARDAVNGDKNIHKAGREEEKTVISLGNGYITDYSVDISVGAIPTASVTVEGMNIKSDFGETGNDVPAVDMRDGSYVSSAWDKNAAGDRISKGALGCTGLYSLPPATSGYDGCEGSIAAALRPGDVVVDLNNAGLISKQVSGDANSPLLGSAHVQSVSISVPMGRTTLQRLGSTFGFSKALDVPMTVTMSVSALLSEIKEGNMADLLCDCTKLDVGVKIYDPECVECVTKDEGLAMSYTLKGARLESENFTSTIGDNKTVDLTFTATIGGSDDPDNGLFISGKESNDATIKGFPPSWTGLNGRENTPASGLYMGYRS